MEKPTRRNLLKAAAVGGVTATGLSAVFGVQGGLSATTPIPKPGKQDDEHQHDDDDDKPLSGKRALAVVSFGQWEVENEGPAPGRGPVDRMAAVPNNRNVHKHLPFEVEVDQGGAVSFVISGFHQILIYEDTTAADLQAAWLAAGSPLVLPTTPPGLVDYATNRIYRGLSPIGLPLDRVESVNFLLPGRYLVICGLRPHFVEGMHGYVNVRERD